MNKKAHVQLFCDLMNCSLSGSSVHGISQARMMEWLPFSSPEYLPDPKVKPAFSVLAGRLFTTELPRKTKGTRAEF